MKTIRTGMMTLAALAVLGTNVVSATSEPVKELSVNVNGQHIEQAAIFDKGQQTVLVPLRDVAESLGFQVKWNAETKAAEVNKGAIFSYAKVGEDRYPFAKMYKTLGAEPRLLNGNTYVPVAFVDEILQAEVNVTDDAVTVVDEESDVAPVRTGTITTLNKREDGGVSFQLNGYETGIILHVDKETKITTADGKELKPEDLQLGMEVEATHQKFMAMSMPQSGAVSIVVKSGLETPEVLGTAGKVASIDKDQEGSYKMLVEGQALAENAPEKVALIVGKDTKIVSAKDNKELAPEDLKAEMKVFAYYGPKLTRSLPPIGVAEKIVVE
uniref:Protease inhibitor n=1 Tax=Brevibacillus choshinensis TaxID=54911 RepID=SPI_BRECH|nr:RecName: Full=Protease inhibitor; AltName: Full=BBRPI; Contains: RecName: Full=Serine protease inhibitor; Contains: RecName: Full=Serine protease inhibitor C; Contains: RecName: Full=Serine protease inhibitor B; Contains: RecName: Full=Serine protease inhibitor A; Flags: Precursor [Brevibacillus choshinensis]pir/A43939/ proteinase inhibitor BbrPI - Bacillus brevis [Brevibacillus brevis]BAA01538.1 protease inhibitor precursor [Brevibacillus brevis]